MSQIQLIINVIGWERKLEFEEARSMNRRSDLFSNFLAALQPCHKISREDNQQRQAPVNFLQAFNSNQ